MLLCFVLIALTCAWAWPSYSGHLRRGYRVQAQVGLMEAAHFLERYRAAHLRFVDAQGGPPELPAGLLQLPSQGRPRYYLELAQVDAQTYTLRAVPWHWVDQDCGALSLDHLGRRTADGPAPSSRCWER